MTDEEKAQWLIETFRYLTGVECRLATEEEIPVA